MKTKEGKEQGRREGRQARKLRVLRDKGIIWDVIFAQQNKP